MNEELKIIPLGGIGEIGKNSTLLELDNELILIDCGFKFPPADMPGVDFVIPDFSYIAKRKANLKAVLLTHGHLDHIGALSYLIEEAKPQFIIGSDLTLGLVKESVKNKSSIEFRVVKSGDVFNIGKFSFQFVRMTHSIPGSFGIAVKTSQGSVFFTGDYKIDATPVDGKPMDIVLLENLRKEGLTALFSDSTNADEPGLTGSESIVGQNLLKIFEKAPGRIIVSTFSTNIHRIQQIIDVSERTKRKVFFDGRSLVESVKIASKLGYLRVPKDIEANIANISSIPKKEMTLITTGTQGEPMSGMVRISNGMHNGIRIAKGDSVLISGDPIPGNERVVSDTVNKLFKLGAIVYYRKTDGIHVSGHCSQEDIRFLINLLKPKYFIPVHGEFKHLVFSKGIAEQEGIPSNNIFLLENGMGVGISKGKMRRLPRIQSGEVIVEGNIRIPIKEDKEIEHIIERKEMAHKGVVFAVAVVNSRGEIIQPIHIETRGLVLPKGTEGEILKKTKEKVVETIRKMIKIHTQEEIESAVEEVIKKIFKDSAKRSPTVFTVIVKEKK
ncbi:MAG: ribonuclease J [Caldisericaceae bacterium]